MKYIVENEGPNRKQRFAIQNEGKTSKCGKRKKIHEPARVEKRFNKMMDGREFVFKFFQRVGINVNV